MTRTLTALALAAASLTLGTAAQAHTPHPLRTWPMAWRPAPWPPTC